MRGGFFRQVGQVIEKNRVTEVSIKYACLTPRKTIHKLDKRVERELNLDK